MPKMRRFPDDETEEVTEPVEAPTLRRRPADKRWRRPHSDKTSRSPVSDGGASSMEKPPDGNHG